MFVLYLQQMFANFLCLSTQRERTTDNKSNNNFFNLENVKLIYNENSRRVIFDTLKSL